MFTMILTWIGALCGLVLLVAMAAGTFVVDFDDKLRERALKNPKLPEGTRAAPLI